MSVLRPFVLDPLLTDQARAGGDQQSGKVHLQNVENRLKGFITRKKKTLQSQPLSVEGQVNHLITEATDLNNLVRICHLSFISKQTEILCLPGCDVLGLGPVSLEKQLNTPRLPIYCYVKYDIHCLREVKK